MRNIEYKRKAVIQKEQRKKIQDQYTRDYVKTHSELALKNEDYPLTEKVFTGTPEALEVLLLSLKQDLEVAVTDFPQGLVLDY